MPPITRTETSDRSRRSLNWQARRNAIVDTSAKVFARQGYHATGIAELCVANELGKGALYHYIGSKEELLGAIHDRVIDELIAGAQRVEEAGGTPSEQLVRLGDELLDVITRFPDHVWVFPRAPARIREAGRDDPGGGHRGRRIPYRRAPANGDGLARDAQLHLPLAQVRGSALGARGCGELRRHLHRRHHGASP
jgi:AcrR family transcriptional regulator